MAEMNWKLRRLVEYHGRRANADRRKEGAEIPSREEREIEAAGLATVNQEEAE